jgi:hypothetical protein
MLASTSPELETYESAFKVDSCAAVLVLHNEIYGQAGIQQMDHDKTNNIHDVGGGVGWCWRRR